ncbi:MAG: hypothetical protein QOE70_6203 [Chthoniobacter sp.]|jgi:hypothetical protein|nr:hypothetical protein [Chthoniobacter sp.]
MKGIRALFLAVALHAVPASQASAADLQFGPLDQYVHFSFILRIESDNPGDPSLRVGLPTRRDPSTPKVGSVQFVQHGRTQISQKLDAQQSQTLYKAIQALLADYVLAPPPKNRVSSSQPRFTVFVGTSDESANFTFVKDQASQWKKATDAWNAVRALIPKEQIENVPVL